MLPLNRPLAEVMVTVSLLVSRLIIKDAPFARTSHNIQHIIYG
jgi:hypothetical protein